MAEKVEKKSKPNKKKNNFQKRRFRVSTKTEGKCGTVFIGSEDPFLYFPDMMSYFDRPEIDEIKLKARGKSISNAVNVAEQFKNRFKKEFNTKVDNVDIGTEEVPRKDKKGKFRMSFIEISVSAKVNEMED